MNCCKCCLPVNRLLQQTQIQLLVYWCGCKCTQSFPFTSLSSGFKSVSFLNTIYTEFALTSLLCFVNRMICIEVNRLPLGAFQSMSSCPDFHGHHAITRTTECVMVECAHTLRFTHISLTFTPTEKEKKQGKISVLVQGEPAKEETEKLE